MDIIDPETSPSNLFTLSHFVRARVSLCLCLSLFLVLG